MNLKVAEIKNFFKYGKLKGISRNGAVKVYENWLGDTTAINTKDGTIRRLVYKSYEKNNESMYETRNFSNGVCLKSINTEITRDSGGKIKKIKRTDTKNIISDKTGEIKSQHLYYGVSVDSNGMYTHQPHPISTMPNIVNNFYIKSNHKIERRVLDVYNMLANLDKSIEKLLAANAKDEIRTDLIPKTSKFYGKL